MKGPEGELQKDLEGLKKDLERMDAPPAHWRTASVTAPILRSDKHAKRISLLHISLVSLVYFANPTRCALPSAAGGAAIINTMMNNIFYKYNLIHDTLLLFLFNIWHNTFDVLFCEINTSL